MKTKKKKTIKVKPPVRNMPPIRVTPSKIYDAATGITAFEDHNGYLHLANVPIMKSGNLKQIISRLEGFNGARLSTITDEDRNHGWAWAHRSDKEVFNKKAMESFLGIPVFRQSTECSYYDCTMKEKYYRYIGLESHHEPNGPIGTVTAVRRGKGAKKNCLLLDITIWNVHAFTESIIGKYFTGITSVTKLLNKCVYKGDAKIKQVDIRARCLVLIHSDVFGFNILDNHTKFRKWFNKRFIDRMVIRDELEKSSDEKEIFPPPMPIKELKKKSK